MDDHEEDWRQAHSSPPSNALPGPYIGASNDTSSDADDADDPPRPGDTGGAHWRSLLSRWLFTLNPGRTQDEYEKAVRYFFEAPGVPQWVAEVSADLLLAYRGSLALRADRRRHSRPRRAPAARRDTLWSGAPGSTLSGPEGATPQGDGADSASSATRPAALRQEPLSPATVNIRLTALRQFLLFASERGALAPDLAPERVRSALRRLRNERRRPYQTLAEEEWGEFLQAALTPAERPAREASPTAIETPAPTAPSGQRGPWGVTRAARERQRADMDAAPPPDAIDDVDASDGVAPTQARDHRTGAHTAQRDHALISLALATGLRAIELSLLDVGDLTSERRRGRVEWWLNLPDEKTKGQRGGRTLPLAPELIATLFAYIRSTGRAWEQPEHRATPLFLALNAGRHSQSESAPQDVMRADGTPERRYHRLRPEQIRGVVHRVEEQWLARRRAEDGDAPEVAGEARHLSPHALRHSAAIALLLGDEVSERPPASVEHVRGWLGHFDIRTTQRYLSHIESREQRRRFAIRPQTRRAPAESPETALGAPEQPPLLGGEN